MDGEAFVGVPRCGRRGVAKNLCAYVQRRKRRDFVGGGNSNQKSGRNRQFECSF